MHPVFYLEKGTLLLEVPPVAIPAEIEEYALDNGLSPKKEFHVTIIGFGLAKSIATYMEQQGIPAEKRKQIFAYLDEFAKTLIWSYKTKDQYFHLHKRYPNGVDRESIIVLIELQGHQPFLQKIKDLFNISVALFPHLTLYAKTSDPEEMPIMGIGIQDLSEFLLADKKIITA